MAAVAAVATVGAVSSTVSALVGTETITATVGAGQVAVVIDSTVKKHSLPIDTIIGALADALREAGYSA